MLACFGSHAPSHIQSWSCSDVTVCDHALPTLGFSASSGSYPARLNRTAANEGLTASQGACKPWEDALTSRNNRIDTLLSHRDEGTPGGDPHPVHSPVLPHSALSLTLRVRKSLSDRTLLPKLHLNRVVTHSSCEAYSEDFSVLFPEAGNQQTVHLFEFDLSDVSFRCVECMQCSASKQCYAENQLLHSSEVWASCSLLRPNWMWAFQDLLKLSHIPLSQSYQRDFPFLKNFALFFITQNSLSEAI